MTSPFISVAICTFDRANDTRKLLDALAPQAPAADCEIIVVNNGPTEKTEALAARYTHARYVREEVAGLSRARNAAVRAAKGAYILFLDDDVALPDGYLAKVYGSLREHTPDLFGGPVDPAFDGPPPKWVSPELLTRRKNGRSGWTPSGEVSGGNFAVRREVLEEIGGFREELGMIGTKLGFLEEFEFALRYRMTRGEQRSAIYYDLDCAVGHAAPPEKTRVAYLASRSFRSHFQRGRLFASLAHPRRRSAFRVAAISSAIADGAKHVVASILKLPKRGRSVIGDMIVANAGRVGLALGALQGPRLTEGRAPRNATLRIGRTGGNRETSPGEQRCVVSSLDRREIADLAERIDFWAFDRIVFEETPTLSAQMWLARESPRAAVELAAMKPGPVASFLGVRPAQ